MAERRSGHARDPLDWYVEPASVVHALFNHVAITGAVHDPCCGVGTIPDAVASRGIASSGADIAARDPRFPVRNFLHDTGTYNNIVTNPPFRAASDIIRHAKRRVRPGGVVAVIAQAKFLYSQGRVELFESCERVLILSRRPSMPTGEALAEHGESIRGNGSIDFCWCVWRAGVDGPTDCKIDWML
jgi:tRNA1(Val) A37 N6-methylase TrmN6